jgi:ribosomal-protein-alanine N-acetyltransferase
MRYFQWNEFPVIQLEQATLRGMLPTDAEALFVLRSNPHIMHYVPRPLATHVDEATQLIAAIQQGFDEGNSLTWGIAEHTSNRIIGTLGFWRIEPENHRAEIGYLLHTDYHGKGLMKAAIRAACEFVFDALPLHSIEAKIDSTNIASWKTIEHCGFRREAHFRENFFHKGQFVDTYVYGLLRSDV